MENFEPIVNFFYAMPRWLFENVDKLTKRPLNTFKKRMSSHLRDNLEYHIGPLENADGNDIDHPNKLSAEQMAGYLSLFYTYNDFDVPHFQQLPLANPFSIDPNNIFHINLVGLKGWQI